MCIDYKKYTFNIICGIIGLIIGAYICASSNSIESYGLGKTILIILGCGFVGLIITEIKFYE